jgi:diguanylate cyclase (GGDEF)-like protein
MASRELLVVEDLAQTLQWPQFTRRALRLGVRSVLSLPLLARGQVWGSLDLMRSTPGPYSSDDLATAGTLADVATSYVVMAVDRDAAIALQEKMTHRAMHDELTGLPNRALLFDRLSHAITSARRRKSLLALLFIDLDGFKQVNDTLGHVAGDALLIEVAERLTAVLRQDDTLARLSGDEFVIICENLPASEESGASAAINALIERVQLALTEPARLGDVLCEISASIGSAAAAPDHHSAEDMLREADHDMYRVKRSRRRGRADPSAQSPDRPPDQPSASSADQSPTVGR